MPACLVRTGAGFLAATLTAFLARRAGALSTSGAIAAAIVGTASVVAGWNWGTLLVLYFVASTALSRIGIAEKERRTGGVVAKGGARDAAQVFANGGVFALGALAASALGAPPTLVAGAVGALAAAAADTWATEIGVLLGGTPRSVLTLRAVPPGTSGGVSAAGTIAMISGALFVALAARTLALTDALSIVTLAGCAGALADTLIGATLQERRWCDACGLATERLTHDCHAATRFAGGVPGMDNDVVNLLATLTGAAAAALLAFAS